MKYFEFIQITKVGDIWEDVYTSSIFSEYSNFANIKQ